jgi:general secretion pathway protein H
LAVALRQGGFTLFEMLAVMALVAVACALLATAATRGLAGARERQAPGELLQVLREARVQARRERQRVSVYFDVPALCYRREAQKRRCLPTSLQWQLQVAATPAESEPAIHFYPDGSSSGGNVRLRMAGREQRIDVSWLTGVASLGMARP